MSTIIFVNDLGISAVLEDPQMVDASICFCAGNDHLERIHAVPKTCDHDFDGC
jgi:hypothetical protein